MLQHVCHKQGASGEGDKLNLPSITATTRRLHTCHVFERRKASLTTTHQNCRCCCCEGVWCVEKLPSARRFPLFLYCCTVIGQAGQQNKMLASTRLHSQLRRGAGGGSASQFHREATHTNDTCQHREPERCNVKSIAGCRAAGSPAHLV